MGGAERWLVSLVGHSDPDLILWTGVAISASGGTDQSLCEELSGLTRLYCQQPDSERRTSTRPFHTDYFESIEPRWEDAVAAACRDADIVVVWGGVGHAGKWVERLSIPSVLVSHTTEQEDDPAAITEFTHLAAVSEAAAEYFDGRDGRDNYEEVRVLYNGSDQRRCSAHATRSEERANWGISTDDIAIGYLGRESKEKNFMAAAEAAIELGEPFKAVYHGSLVNQPDCHAEELKQLAEDEHPDRVVLRMPKPQVGDILSALDVMVLASHREAFSLSLIEAWLSGVPVVATPVGCLPELERKHEAKLAVEVPLAPSPEQLAEAVKKAIGPEGQKVVESARELAEREFTCDAMAHRWTAYLIEIVDEHRRTRPAQWLSRRLARFFRRLIPIERNWFRVPRS